jgi:hypothetical protein
VLLRSLAVTVAGLALVPWLGWAILPALLLAWLGTRAAKAIARTDGAWMLWPGVGLVLAVIDLAMLVGSVEWLLFDRKVVA